MSSITAGMETKIFSLYQPLKKKRYLMSTLADDPHLLKPYERVYMCVGILGICLYCCVGVMNGCICVYVYFVYVCV